MVGRTGSKAAGGCVIAPIDAYCDNCERYVIARLIPEVTVFDRRAFRVGASPSAEVCPACNSQTEPLRYIQLEVESYPA